jgi:PAS domain S-box-containing protein
MLLRKIGAFNIMTGKTAIEKTPKKMEKNFIILLNFIADPAVIIDDKGRFLVVNNAFEDLTGLKGEELISTAFLEMTILSAESKMILLENLKKRMKGISIEPYEIAFVDKNGKTRYVEIKAREIYYARQSADLVIFRDITRRKENAKRLEEYSEKMEALVNEKVRETKEHKGRFETIFNSSPDAITLSDLTGTIIECNEATSRLLGFSSRGELIGKNAFELLVPKEQEKAALLMEDLSKNGFINNLEITILTKDGKEFPVEASISIIKDDAGNPVGLVAITKDISERKKMEDELKRERDMLEAVTENIGAGLIIIDRNYRTLWANGFIRRYKGDVEGKLCYASLNTLNSVCPDCGVKKVFKKGVAVHTHEYSSEDINGNPYTVELIATPIKDKDGNVVAALELAVDITDKKRMQSELAEYSQKLEKLVNQRTQQLKQTQAKLVKTERLAAIGELAAMIGHDLRNPLTGIKGAAYYLTNKGKGSTDSKTKEMLKTIEECIDYSNKIINDLLEYSREMKLDLTETNAKTVLERSLSTIKFSSKIKVVDVSGRQPKIIVDQAKMCRVFINIIQNAIDAMPEGGTIAITSRKLKDNLEIVFRDTGTGMSEETLGKLRLWVPLFTTKAKGMGFGLAICKRIVEAHGGKLMVESQLGKGTIVTVTIPIRPVSANVGEHEYIFSDSSFSAAIKA